MTYAIKGNSPDPHAVAALTAVHVRIAPADGTSPVLTTTSVFAKDILGIDRVNAGNTLHTTPVVMSSRAGSFAGGVWIDYIVSNSASMATPIIVVQCR